MRPMLICRVSPRPRLAHWFQKIDLFDGLRKREVASDLQDASSTFFGKPTTRPVARLRHWYRFASAATPSPCEDLKRGRAPPDESQKAATH